MGSMSNDKKEEFVQACKIALEDGSFKRVTFTGSAKGQDKLRCKFELVLGGKSRFLEFSDNRSNETQRLAYHFDELADELGRSDISAFRAALLSTQEFDFHYAENRKKEARVYKAKPTMRDAVQSHNRAKHYVLDQKRPYLKSLGITSPKGEVIKKSYGKFRQIANFVEIIDRDIGEFVANTERPISLLDLGCGKGYLTFAAFDYLLSKAQKRPEGLGVDIKPNVINQCNALAQKIGFDGLKFKNARIHKDQNDDVDILIALHACDTATDDALALGLRSNMNYFFCAPCCQAEIARQLSDDDSDFGIVNSFPLMRRRQADIITDVCRALLLQAFGYDVKFLEFTPMEHTSKNVMLAGKRNDRVDRQKAYHEYLALKKSTGFDRHQLEDNLQDLIDTQIFQREGI